MTRSASLRLALGLVAALGLFLAPFAGGATPALAHPIGNFTVNRYARLELEAGRAHLRYVLDMAEIPAFQELQALDSDGDGAAGEAESAAYLARRLPEIARNLHLRINGARLELASGARQLSFPEGQGGLRTLRLVADFEGAMPPGWEQGVRASFRDDNYSDRVGWKEIVVRAGEGVALTESSAAAAERSQELTAYPESLLKSPLDVREASFAFGAGTTPFATSAAAKPAETKTAARRDRSLGGFAALVGRQKLTPAFVAVSLLAAMAWGAAHAIGPGHGKTIVGAYLVGSRGTARHALALGLTVTATHTSSVVALGLVTLYASRYVVAEDLYLWLSVASGVLVLAIGGGLFWSRLRAVRGRHPQHNAEPSNLGTLRRGSGQAFAPGFPDPRVHDEGDPHQGHTHDDGDRHQGHGHGHDDEKLPSQRPKVPGFQGSSTEHGHSHLPSTPGWRGLLMLGISGGLLPCPTALVVMLGAIALDRVAYGLALIVAFSSGLAAVLTAIGIALVYAGRILGRESGGGRLGGLLRRSPLTLRLVRVVPLGSAFMIFVVGLLLTGQAVAAL